MKKIRSDALSLICAVRATVLCISSAAICFSGAAHAYEEAIHGDGAGGGGNGTSYLEIIASIATQANSAGFSKVTIPKGSHFPSWAPWVSTKPVIKFNFSFDPSAIYYTPGSAQLDWNGLPGVSDCGSMDKSVNGAMFGWRWDHPREKLQITALANVDAVPQSWGGPNWPSSNPVLLVELNKSDILQFAPLTYEIKLEPLQYRFSIQGVLPSGQMISSVSTLPRKCSKNPPVKQGSTMQFGTTVVAPHKITGHVKWLNR